MYPWGITKEEIEQALALPGGQANKREKVLDLRLLFVAPTRKIFRDDIASLNKYPALQTLHPGLLAELQRLVCNLTAKDRRLRSALLCRLRG